VASSARWELLIFRGTQELGVEFLAKTCTCLIIDRGAVRSDAKTRSCWWLTFDSPAAVPISDIAYCRIALTYLSDVLPCYDGTWMIAYFY